jgi:hypothetical protein
MLTDFTSVARSTGYTIPVFVSDAAQKSCRLVERNANFARSFFKKCREDLLNFGYQSGFFNWTYKNYAEDLCIHLSVRPQVHKDQIVLVFSMQGEF